MEYVEVVEKRAGGGVGRRDDSSDLADMTYAEKLIFSDEFLQALKGLKVQKLVGSTLTGGNIILTQDDFLQYRTDGKAIGMNGHAHMVNKVFVAGRLPFYATSMATEHAEKVKMVKTRGENKGDLYTSVKADRLRIYRISEKFSINHYAIPGSNSLKETPYHVPTTGMVARVRKILAEKGLTF